MYIDCICLRGVARGVRGCDPHRAALARGGKMGKIVNKMHIRLYQFLFAYEEHKIAIAKTRHAQHHNKSQQPNYTLIILSFKDLRANAENVAKLLKIMRNYTVE